MAGPRITDSEREAVQRLRNQGLTWKETAEAMIKTCPEAFGQLSINQAYHRCRNASLGVSEAGSHKKINFSNPFPTAFSEAPMHRFSNGKVESFCLIELFEGEDLTPDQLLAYHKLDPEKWQITSYTNNVWHGMTSQKNDNALKQLYQSKLTAKPKADGISFEEIDKHFQLMDRAYTPPAIRAKRPAGHMMAEVNIADLHLGRLSWHGDTGYNYDHKIARNLFMDIVSEVYHELKQKQLEFITFVWTNDFFNSDTILKTTTQGTPQDTDVRWQKLFNVGVDLLVDAIVILSELAPVKTFYTASNHDEITSYHAIKYLEAWFRKDQSITINTDARPRKYQLYGNTLIGYTHGDKEKPARLASMIPNEARTLWGSSVTREMHAAHLHSEHAIEEVNGVIVRRISSPTAPDTWSDKAGYVTAVRKAQTFLYDRERGLLQIINTPVINAQADCKNRL